MPITYGSDKKRAVQAKFDAQKIAFGPIMFQAALALRNLGILQLVKDSEEGITMEEVAERLHLPLYGVKVLLEAGLSLELVWSENGRFRITKTGWFILCDELTRVNMDFTQDVNYLGMFSLTESVKTGKPTGLKVFGDWPTVYEGLSQLPAQVQKSWFSFDHFYSDYAFPEIMPVVFRDNPGHILDVGGNTGKFAMQCAAFNKETRITILDLPGQLAKAALNIRTAGFEDRIDLFPINLLDHSNPFPKNPDIIWYFKIKDSSKFDILRNRVLTFGEEFDGTGIDTSKWITNYYWGEKLLKDRYSIDTDLQFYTEKDNLEVRNSYLRINTKPQRINGKAWSPLNGFTTKEFGYTSGLVNTGNSFRQKFGVFTAKIKLGDPASKSAFWLLGDKIAPHIDICRTTNGKVWFDIFPGTNKIAKSTVGARYAGNSYIFTLEWTATSLVWKINGVEAFRQTENVPQEPMYINLAGGLNKPINGTTSMEVDWVRVYQVKN